MNSPEEHTKLVHKIINERFPFLANDEDAYQEGCLALVNASRGWDETHGTRFSTYACVSIRNGIIHYLNTQNAKKRKLYQAAIRTDFYSIPSQTAREPIDLAADRELKLRMLQGLRKMRPRYRRIIYQRYFKFMKLDDIAKKEGCCRERARQLVALGMRELRIIWKQWNHHGR